MASDAASTLSDFGAAVSDLFGARGSAASAQSYRDAAAIAKTNEQIAATATQVQETQEQRQIYKTLGAQQAAVSSAGFAASGTALDLLRDSATQGALTKALTAEQGAIEVNSYAEQAGFYNGMADAADAAGKGQQLGGLLNLAAGGLNLASTASSLFSSPVIASSGFGNAATAGSGVSVVGYGGAGDVAATGSDVAVPMGGTPAGVYAAVALGAQDEVQNFKQDPGTSAALVASGLNSVVTFPTVALNAVRGLFSDDDGRAQFIAGNPTAQDYQDLLDIQTAAATG